MTTPTAIFFHPDAVESEGTTLVGRRSSGQSFLDAWLRRSRGGTVRAVTASNGHARTFGELAAARGVSASVIPLHYGQPIEDNGTIFFPGPGLMNAPTIRQTRGAASCSLVGITHTVSTRRVMEGLHRLPLEPVHDWDAIICTSRAVHGVVRTQLEESAAYIRERFGARHVPLPQLPIIPLGIDTAAFAPEPDARERMRARFEVPNDAVVVMSMGRLTSVEKANMLPLWQALERVASETDANVHLWQVGWSSREAEGKLHADGPAQVCPSVMTRTIDGREADIRRDIWAGADIFTLPVDNIQETFGLVPVEAMAAGLPVVMPDWNGFRDTVRHGETGFLVPTSLPGPEGMGRIAAQRFADGRDGYLAHLSILQQMTVIDTEAYAGALRRLVTDADLRQRMGSAGQAHVREQFDWDAVLPRYQALADDLAQRRDGASVATGVRQPTAIDPFALYAAYPTRHPSPEDTVTYRRRLDAAALADVHRLSGRALYDRKVLPDPKMLGLSQIVEDRRTLTIGAAAKVAGLPPEQAIAGIQFLAKFDFVTVTPQEPK